MAHPDTASHPTAHPKGAPARELLDMLVCPVSKGPLDYDEARQELISRRASLAFPVREGIPVLLAEEARKLDETS